MDNRALENGIAYDEWVKQIDSITPTRPACPECGSRDVRSEGTDYYCKDCGRYFTKIRRPHVLVSDGLDVRCPNCGAGAPISNGKRRWICPDCGRQWMKEKP
jgi:transposase-like protein